jgi:hypothetical protein
LDIDDFINEDDFIAQCKSPERSGTLKICEFCLHYKQDDVCGLGLKIPKSMTCREFGPTLEQFCSDAKDFVDPKQIVQMATYFGIKGPELKKIKVMAAREESMRL